MRLRTKKRRTREEAEDQGESPHSVCFSFVVSALSYVHGGVNLADGLVVGGELIDLDAVAHQLTHDLDLELVELTLGDGVGFGNDGDDVDLRGGAGVRGGERRGGGGGKDGGILCLHQVSVHHVSEKELTQPELPPLIVRVRWRMKAETGGVSGRQDTLGREEKSSKQQVLDSHHNLTICCTFL